MRNPKRKVYLDTSSLIRFFTKDDESKASKVKEILEKEKYLIIPDVVFPEIEYILRRLYKTERTEIIKIFQFLTSLTNLKLSKTIKQAITIFETTHLDVADCLIAASSLGNKLASFDNDLLKTPGVTSYWEK